MSLDSLNSEDASSLLRPGEGADSAPVLVASSPGSVKAALALTRGTGIGTRPVWAIRDIVAGIVLAVISIVILGVAIIVPAIEVFGEDTPGARAFQGLTIIVWDLSLIGIVTWLARRKGGNTVNLGWRQPWEGETWGFWKLARIGAGAYVCSLVVLYAYNLILTVAGLEDLLPSQQIPEDFFDTAWLIPIIGVSIVVTAPVCEEFFFRGFIYAGLRRSLRVPFAALLSGFLFSMAHADVGLVLPFTLIGAILAIVYERTGSLWANIGVHFWFNLVSFTVLVLLGGDTG
jgi:membrane protease YdiL (CAAX protease family)